MTFCNKSGILAPSTSYSKSKISFAPLMLNRTVWCVTTKNRTRLVILGGKKNPKTYLTVCYVRAFRSYRSNPRTLYLSKKIFLHMFYNAPYYFAKQQLIFEILVPNLGRYPVCPHSTDWTCSLDCGRRRKRQMMFLSFLTIFNDLMRNQNFPALPSKIFRLSHGLDGNAHLSCKYMSQSWSVVYVSLCI